jgi:hypothetical protein
MKGEIIPNNEFLFKYVNPSALPVDQEEIPYGIFEDKELSCDWEKYQKKPERSYHIKEGKNLIIKITVCDEIKYPCNPKRPTVKQQAWEQTVEHDPLAKGEDLMHPEIENIAHSLIKGLKRIHITTAIAENSVKYKIVDPNTEYLDEDGPTTIIAHKNSLSITRLLIIIIVAIILIVIFKLYYWH